MLVERASQLADACRRSAHASRAKRRADDDTRVGSNAGSETYDADGVADSAITVFGDRVRARTDAAVRA